MLISQLGVRCIEIKISFNYYREVLPHTNINIVVLRSIIIIIIITFLLIRGTCISSIAYVKCTFMRSSIFYM